MGLENGAWTQATLAEHYSHGEYLLQSARMVGDPDDHAIWRGGRLAWLETVAATIGGAFSLEQAAHFREACQAPTDPESWKRQYEAELRALAAGLELLVALRKAIAEQEAPVPVGAYGDRH